MSAGYGRIAFTKAVQDEQEHHGSRRFYARHQARAEQAGGPDRLTGEVHNYLAERDSFYLASVSETGWPYVQFRGGRRASSRCCPRTLWAGPTFAATATRRSTKPTRFPSSSPSSPDRATTPS